MENKMLNIDPKYKVLDGFTLKMIAIITMLIDHVGHVIFPEIAILRIIGRFSFPIFCFLLVEGFFHTSNVKKYMFGGIYCGVQRKWTIRTRISRNKRK